MERRIGKFFVSRDLIWNNSDLFQQLMELGKFIILRAESLDYQGTYEYVALSPIFDVLSEGQAVPEYSIKVTDGEPPLIMAKMI